MEFRPGVTAVAAPEIEAAAAAAKAQGMPVFVLSTGVGGGYDAFFEAVRVTLPLDPPLASNYSWDALSDSLFGGLFTLGVDRVLLVWPDAAEMVAAAPGEAAMAREVLADVVATLSEPKFTQGQPLSLAVLVGMK